jgi:hypothetical protein
VDLCGTYRTTRCGTCPASPCDADLDGKDRWDCATPCDYANGACDFDDGTPDTLGISVVGPGGTLLRTLKTHGPITLSQVTTPYHPHRTLTRSFCSSLDLDGGGWRPLEEADVFTLTTADYPFDTCCGDSWESIFNTAWDGNTTWVAPAEPMASHLTVAIYGGNSRAIFARDFATPATSPEWFAVWAFNGLLSPTFETDPGWPDAEPQVVCARDCVPETNSAFCERIDGCGQVTLPDNCGVNRTVDCSGPDCGDFGSCVSGSCVACGTSVYVTDNAHNGNFGGRSGLDAFCASEKPESLTCSSIHALISVASGDAIVNMPTNYGFAIDQPLCWFNPGTGLHTQFATGWEDMLDGTISVSRLAGTGNPGYTWTGSTNSGRMTDGSGNNRACCQSWTSTYGRSAWNFTWSFNGNVGSGLVSLAHLTSDWLWHYSPWATKQALGPDACCYFQAFSCPSSCPAADHVESDSLLCAATARVMCACAR